MRRLTISVDDALAETFDRLVAERGYENRSEAFRDLLRDHLDKKRLEAGDAKFCVGVLSYVTTITSAICHGGSRPCSMAITM